MLEMWASKGLNFIVQYLGPLECHGLEVRVGRGLLAGPKCLSGSINNDLD